MAEFVEKLLADLGNKPMTSEHVQRYLFEQVPISESAPKTTNKKIMSLIKKRKQVEEDLKSAIMTSDVYYSQLQTYGGNVNHAYAAALKYYMSVN